MASLWVSPQDVQNWVNFSLLEEKDFKLSDIIGSLMQIVPHQN